MGTRRTQEIIDHGRRAFLAGRFSRVPVIEAGCLNRIGSYCERCRDACGESAIDFVRRAGGLGEPRLDAARCSGCGECVASCPVGAIAGGRGTRP